MKIETQTYVIRIGDSCKAYASDDFLFDNQWNFTDDIYDAWTCKATSTNEAEKKFCKMFELHGKNNVSAISLISEIYSLREIVSELLK